MMSRFRSIPRRRALASAGLILALALGLHTAALADGGGADAAAKTYKVGDATIRLLPAPKLQAEAAARRAELVARYRQLLESRFAQAEPPAAAEAATETRAAGLRQSRVPAELIDTMFVRVGGDGRFDNYCAAPASASPEQAAGGGGEE